ncbi:hypothetical protein QF001_003749 [Paraburkholderia youngii]|uniref:hypothetical protein n=1 Tax=Paraburkholderia youngii TaxID=2782701 RepID=UPI003D239199
MPLKQGYSRRTVGHNIKVEQQHGRPRKQAVAIALQVAQKAARKAIHAGKSSKLARRMARSAGKGR